MGVRWQKWRGRFVGPYEMCIGHLCGHRVSCIKCWKGALDERDMEETRTDDDVAK